MSSNFAREHAPVVAIAASLGFITVHFTDGHWGRTWHVTVPGLRYLERNQEP